MFSRSHAKNFPTAPAPALSQPLLVPLAFPTAKMLSFLHKVACGVLGAALLLSPGSEGHGHLTLPPSRNGGTLAKAADCMFGECMWFSQPVAGGADPSDTTATIKGEPTLNDKRYEAARRGAATSGMRRCARCAWVTQC